MNNTPINSLILYCKEQAIPWEACKARTCQSLKCLFSRAVKKIGTTDLGLTSPGRYSSVTAMEVDREKLIEQGLSLKELRLSSKLDANSDLETSSKKIIRIPLIVKIPPKNHKHTSPTDILVNTIEDEINKVSA